VSREGCSSTSSERCQRKGEYATIGRGTDCEGAEYGASRTSREDEKQVPRGEEEALTCVSAGTHVYVYVHVVWKRPLRDNEAAHECRNEWVLFTIANSGPSGLAGLHPSRRLIHVASQPLRTSTGKVATGEG